MRCYSIFLCLCFSFLSLNTIHSAEIVYNINFADNIRDTLIIQKGTFQGELSREIASDFPAWNRSNVSSTVETENERRFIRFNVKNIDNAVLFRVTNKTITVPGYYKISAAIRNQCPISFQIRQSPKPYKNFWEDDAKESAAWQTVVFYINLRPLKDIHRNTYYNASDCRLFLSLGSGITDIDSIKFEMINEDEYFQGKLQKIERPEKGTVNLFRNSRFPLGAQSGWNVERDNVFASVTADPANPGPSGISSLKISSEQDKSVTVYSEPFQTDDPTSPLNISFAYKARGKWSAVIHNGQRVELESTTTWKNAKLSFAPKQLTPGFQLIFTGEGTLNIDSLMAYSGNESKEYASAGECEIALQPEKSEISDTHIQFIDEPAKIHFTATGNLNSTILKATVTNIYGTERKLGKIILKEISPDTSGSMQISEGILDYNVFPERPLGPFRIEVWAERDGKRCSPYNEIVINRLRRPVYQGKDAPDSPFGGHFYSNERIVKTMKAAGMNWCRLNDVGMVGTCWGWLEQEKGNWTFSDDVLYRYRKANIRILGYIGSVPTWASSYYTGKGSTDYFDRMFQPTDIESFRNYIRTIVARYKGVIDEYQFQNEPWLAHFWHIGFDSKSRKYQAGQTPAQDYTVLSKIAYEELKSIYPEAAMYGFNTCLQQWTQNVFDSGAYPYCDMIDYHMYNENANKHCLCIPDDKVTRSYQSAIGYIKENISGSIKPVINSEGNPTRGGIVPAALCGSDDCTGLLKHSITWTSKDNDDALADITCRYIISHLALPVKRLFMYSDHCYHYLTRPPTFPVLLGGDGYPHPMMSAFSNLAWLLEDRPFIKTVKIGNDVWAYIFHGRNKSVAFVSGKKTGKYSQELPENIKALDLYGNHIEGKAVYNELAFYLISDLNPEDFSNALSQ